MNYLPDPADPSEVVPDEKDFGFCFRCGDELTEKGVATDDKLFCLECADEMDAAAENEYDRQKEEERE